MTKEDLVISAAELTGPSEKTVLAFSTQKNELSSKVIATLQARQDLEQLVGPSNQNMMSDNAYNMARFMDSMFLSYDPRLFVETILWVFRAYRSHGFKLTFWSAHLNTWIQVIHEDMKKEHAVELVPFYTWIQVNIPQFIKLTDMYFQDS